MSMKYTMSFAAVALGVGLSAAADGAVPEVSGAPFAVVELFTSEGCSSCPPADRVLARLGKLNSKERQIFILGFHVDYWNHLGWRDRFSDRAYSQRQRAYSESLGTNRIYTPQMVINGSAEFIGSKGKTVVNEVNAALKRRPPVATSVTAKYRRSASAVDVEWQLGAVPSGAELLLAVTESNIRSRITRGELRGRTLKYDGVVRYLKVVPLTKTGIEKLKLPASLSPQESAVVLLVQDQTSKRILGASRATL
ncbi:MAG: DUF1223 domain-containing protein [Myxococcota bacterium]